MLHFIINSLKGGGAERLVLNIGKEFQGASILITEPRIDYPTDGVEVKTLTGVWNTFKYLGIPFAALRLRKHIKENDLVVVSLFRSFLLVFLFSFLRKINYICWVHNDTKIYVKNPLLKFVYRIIFNRAHKVVVNSKKAKKDLSDLELCSDEKVQVIYNYLDYQRIQRLKEEEIETPVDFEQEIVFIAAGRLHKVKGFDYLIEAFAKAIKGEQPAKLLILGSGQEEQQIREKIIELGVEQQVLLLGFQKNPYPYIKKSTALLFSSISEGFGNTILEAIICGTPVISTDIDSGPREILSKKEDFLFRTNVPERAKFGILMPSFDKKEAVELWTEIIRKAVSKTSFLEGYNNIDLSDLEDFSDEKIIQQWKEIVNS